MGGLVISGGRVVDPASGMDAIGDVAVVDGKIAAVGTGLGGAGRVIDVEEKPTVSVSTAGGVEEGAVTLPLCQEVIDRSVLVAEDEILDSLRRVYREDGQLVEGAAGVAVAAFRKVQKDYAGKTVVILLCGGNVDAALAKRIQEA